MEDKKLDEKSILESAKKYESSDPSLAAGLYEMLGNFQHALELYESDKEKYGFLINNFPGLINDLTSKVEHRKSQIDAEIRNFGTSMYNVQFLPLEEFALGHANTDLAVYNKRLAVAEAGIKRCQLKLESAKNKSKI